MVLAVDGKGAKFVTLVVSIVDVRIVDMAGGCCVVCKGELDKDEVLLLGEVLAAVKIGVPGIEAVEVETGEVFKEETEGCKTHGGFF